jgi:hypothetical protein
MKTQQNLKLLLDVSIGTRIRRLKKEGSQKSPWNVPLVPLSQHFFKFMLLENFMLLN